MEKQKINEAPRRKQRGIFTGAEFLSPQAAGNLPKEIKIIRNKKPEMESRYGVHRLGLFGSYLESQLQAKVDLVMETALKPVIGKRILSEVEYV
jgi:predicted nucleotidyltransferase